MFDWFSNLFKTGNANGGAGGIDPEAGVPAGQYSGIGRTEGANEGTGEGGMNWGNMSKKQYADLGRSFQQVAPTLIGGGINAGFDQNWLGEQTGAGSAGGQHL